MKSRSVAGIILAGGKSSRFGRDKALFDFQGRPLVAYVIDAFAGAARRIIISVSPGNSAAFAEALGDSVVLVEDDAPFEGPLVGLSKAMELVTEDIVLLAPCDMPFLDAALYRLLLMRIDEHEAAMPFLNGYLEPIVGAYRASSLRKAVKSAISRGERRLSKLLEGLDVISVSELELKGAGIDRMSFMNIDANL
ncbi:MAG: molybdenum cofactor guanylyltransferase [Thermoplasmata archaeon]